MGNENSIEQGHYHEPYMPLNSPRFHGEEVMPLQVHTRSKAKIINSGFYGIWSRFLPESACPEPRSIHFTCSIPEIHKIFIGYGFSETKGYLNDVWALDTTTYSWTELKLTGDQITPRGGSKSVFLGGKIYVFGGYDNKNYFSQLHTIDIITGNVEILETINEIPGRTTPIFFEHNNKLFVWGGFNHHFPTNLEILDLSTMMWETHVTKVSGRTSIPFVKYNNKVYSFGGTKNGCFLVIDPELKTVEEKSCLGSMPNSSLTGGGMVLIDHYAFLFGGKATSHFALLFACDLDKLYWFPFNVSPDAKTVTQSDGNISELGLFQLPRIHSHSLVYDPYKETIIGLLGSPEENPPSIFTVTISDAMSVMHMRDDMIRSLDNAY